MANTTRQIEHVSCDRCPSKISLKDSAQAEGENVQQCIVQNTGETLESSQHPNKKIDFIYCPTTRKLVKFTKRCCSNETYNGSSDSLNQPSTFPTSTDDDCSPQTSPLLLRGGHFRPRNVTKPRPGRVVRRKRFINRFLRSEVQTSDSTGWDHDEADSSITAFRPNRNLLNHKTTPPSTKCISFCLGDGEARVQYNVLTQEPSDQTSMDDAEVYRKKLKTLYMSSYKHSRASVTCESDLHVTTCESDVFENESAKNRSRTTIESYSGDGEESFKHDVNAVAECLQSRRLVPNVDRGKVTPKLRRRRKKRPVRATVNLSDSLDSTSCSPFAGDDSPRRVAPRSSLSPLPPATTSSAITSSAFDATTSVTTALTTASNTTSNSTVSAATQGVKSNPRLVLHALQASGDRPKWPFANKYKQKEVTCRGDGEMVFLFDSEHCEKFMVSKPKVPPNRRLNHASVTATRDPKHAEDKAKAPRAPPKSDTYQTLSGKIINIPIVMCDDSRRNHPDNVSVQSESWRGETFSNSSLGSRALKSATFPQLLRARVSPRAKKATPPRRCGCRRADARAACPPPLGKRRSGCSDNRCSNANLLSVGNNRCYDLSRGLSKFIVDTGGNKGGETGSKLDVKGVVSSKLATCGGDFLEASRRTRTILPARRMSDREASVRGGVIPSSSGCRSTSGDVTTGDTSTEDTCVSVQATRGTERSLCGVRTLQVSRETDEESEGRYACDTIVISKTDVRNESLLPPREPLLLGHLRSGVTKKSSKKTAELYPWIPIYCK